MIFKIIKSNKSFRKCIKNFLFQIENFNNEYQIEISTFTLSDDKKEIAIAFNIETQLLVDGNFQHNYQYQN